MSRQFSKNIREHKIDALEQEKLNYSNEKIIWWNDSISYWYYLFIRNNVRDFIS